MVSFWNWGKQSKWTAWLTLLRINWVFITALESLVETLNLTTLELKELLEIVGRLISYEILAWSPNPGFFICRTGIIMSYKLGNILRIQLTNRYKAFNKDKPTIYFSCHQNDHSKPSWKACVCVTERVPEKHRSHWGYPQDSHEGWWRVNQVNLKQLSLGLFCILRFHITKLNKRVLLLGRKITLKNASLIPPLFLTTEEVGK